MARELDAGTLVPSGPAAWTDYLGTSPWGDFDLTYSGSTPVVSEQMRYLGTAAQQDVSSGDTRHYHGDLIGSTMLLTDEAGGTNFSPASFAYTAFGEAVTPDGSGGWRVGQPVSGAPRYAYAGQWGYETWHGSSGPMFLAGANPNLASIRLSHVGFRWYDASIGRFVHRDPIGILGGVNTYSYALENPVTAADPFGLWTIGVSAGGTGLFGLFPRGGAGPGGSVNIGICMDDNGNIAVTWTAGTGFGAGIFGGRGFSVSASSADTVNDLMGPGAAADLLTPTVCMGVFTGSGYGGVTVGGGGWGGGVLVQGTNTGGVVFPVGTWIGNGIYRLGSGIGLLPSGPPGYNPY